MKIYYSGDFWIPTSVGMVFWNINHITTPLKNGVQKSLIPDGYIDINPDKHG